MKDNGVDKAVIFPCPAPLYFNPSSCDFMDRPLEPSGHDAFPYHLENRDVLRAARKYQNLIPYLSVYPHSKENVKSVKQLAGTNKRVKGLKFHGFAMHVKTTDLIGSEVMEMAGNYDLAVLVHSDATGRWDGYASRYSHPMQAAELAKAHPDVNVIAAHLGCLEERFLEALSSVPNLFTDVGPYVHQFKKIGEEKGCGFKDIAKFTPRKLLEDLDKEFPRKILWSTDEPWTVLSGTGYKEEVGILRELPEAVQHRLAEENITRVLGL
jgi:predicted TIM-barrel fold metal-dependent hydrolase